MTLATLMACILALSGAAGCGDGKNNDSGGGTTVVQEESHSDNGTAGADKTDGISGADNTDRISGTDESGKKKPDLSKEEQPSDHYNGWAEHPMDLNGRVIRIVSTNQERYVPDASNPDNTSNETLSVIAAIESIEKDYNCKFEFEKMRGKTLVQTLITSQAAGEAYCDILEFDPADTYLEQIYTANLLMDLNREPVADIVGVKSNPWGETSSFGQLLGHQYGVHFKTVNSGGLLRGVLLFNKDLLARYTDADPYLMVQDKTWTWDAFMNICNQIAQTSDGVYPMGYGRYSLMFSQLIFANGGTLAEPDSGKYKYTALSDNTLEAYNFAQQFAMKGYVHPQSHASSTSLAAPFADGELVFVFQLYSMLRNYTEGTYPTDYTIGLLPCPLGPSGDGEYCSVPFTDALFHIMDGTKAPEEIASVLVALANRTSRVDDETVNTEMMYSLQDEESVQTLEILLGNVKPAYDRLISTARSQFEGTFKSVMSLDKSPKEALEEVETAIQTIYDGLTISDSTS